MAAMSNTQWQRLGRRVRERREALHVLQGAGGVSVSTWRKVEKAVDPPYLASTLEGIAAALRWKPESIQRILDGGEPIELAPDEVPPDPQQHLEDRLAMLEAAVMTLIRRIPNITTAA
jgi:hypothetical protein